MIKKLTEKFARMTSSCLVLVSDMTVSTSTALLWYEPECPEELQK